MTGGPFDDHGDRADVPGDGRRRGGPPFRRGAGRPTGRRPERWSPLGRLLAWALRYPRVILAVVGPAPPVELDGRVLDRSAQAMLAFIRRVVPVLGLVGVVGRSSPSPMVDRRQLGLGARLAMPSRTDVYAVTRRIPGPPGGPDTRVRIYRRYGTAPDAGTPADRLATAVVFYHGGGWTSGDLESHDAPCRLLASVTGLVVVAVEYRLAPEDPFPAAVEDAINAYRWVHAHTDELGVAPGRVGVMGDSAGGNLAAVVAQQTRPGHRPRTGPGRGAEPAAPPPVAQCLLYPALDAHLDTPSAGLFADGFMLTREAMMSCRESYVPDPEDWESSLVSPLLATEVAGVAPALVVTAGFDPLRDEGASYAGRLRDEGVEVTYRCYDDQIHGFFSMGLLPGGMALATEICAAAGRLLRRSPVPVGVLSAGPSGEGTA